MDPQDRTGRYTSVEEMSKAIKDIPRQVERLFKTKFKSRLREMVEQQDNNSKEK